MAHVTQRHIDRLRRLAEKAVAADEKFADALRRCQVLEGWSTVCSQNGISANANPCDWKS